MADTMRYLFIQINESADFARAWLPSNIYGDNDTEYLFELLKSKVVFINDPPRTELLMTAQTFAKNNFWGIKYAGDCDDFVIFATSLAIAANIPCRIVLAGRKKGEAVHIYNEMQARGHWRAFDLTESFFGSERSYKYKQIIKLYE